MELQTISNVSRHFGVSTRMLRYYEQIGLLQSLKKEEYAYRVYDEAAIRNLQQIILLRKLRIPLKQISEILKNQDAILTIDIFQQQISEFNIELTALTTIKDILSRFIVELKRKVNIDFKQVLFSDMDLLNAIDSLSLTKINFKEEQSMEELNKANQELSKLKKIRIVHLPPCTIAASHYIGENPEENAGEQLEQFLKDSNLYQVKPDARVFGFNHPNPSQERPTYGYELWVTIPEEMEVAAPMVKKHFDGGLYAAHTIVLGDFHEWSWLSNWVNVDNPKYESNHKEDDGECMGGLLEEHLNHVYHASLNWPESDEHQLDLLYPVKLKG